MPSAHRASRFLAGAFAALLGALPSTAVIGCSLGWDVRSAPADAEPDTQITGQDVEENKEAGTEIDASDDVADVPDSSVDCAALVTDLEAKKKAARACVLSSNQCTSTIVDQCNCNVVIAVGGSQEVIAYQTAIQNFVDSGCPKGCAASCPSTTTKNCLTSGCFP